MEEWRSHPKYQKVEVSSEGRVRTFYRYPQGKIVAGGVGNGYRSVYIAEAGGVVAVHVLVAETFHPNPEGHRYVLHRDDNRLNNRESNLYWGSQKRNCADAVQNGKWPKGEKHYRAKIKQKDADYVRQVYQPRHPEFGCRALARKLGVHHTAIRQILNGRSWT